MFCFHKWNYLTKNHRICKFCKKKQIREYGDDIFYPFGYIWITYKSEYNFLSSVKADIMYAKNRSIKIAQEQVRRKAELEDIKQELNYDGERIGPLKSNKEVTKGDFFY